MDRYNMIQIVGPNYHISNIEDGEFSYVKAAGSKTKLENRVGQAIQHYKADIRFKKNNTVVIIETKQNFIQNDEKQLAEYIKEEKSLYPNENIIGILANTNNDKIKVWQSEIDNKHVLKDEIILDKMEHYEGLFRINQQNDREKVLKNTYELNELLHKMDIDEKLRSQFVGTSLLYIKDKVEGLGATVIDDILINTLNNSWNLMTAKAIRADIGATLDKLLDGSDNKTKKINLLQNNVLNDQKVKKLDSQEWITILDTILTQIYRYINADSSEGQDILNMFFIAFNKYTGKADKNQAFTPDHITEFMCQVTGVDREKKVLENKTQNLIQFNDCSLRGVA